MSEYPQTVSIHPLLPPVDTDWTMAADPGLISALRHLARSYRGQSDAEADALVEVTLEAAIREIDHRPEDLGLFDWLSGIMARRDN
jgi:hypothetical protein